MIVGTITLLTILFFGGIQEYFLLDKLEKGVKTHIEDKDRRKEILVDLKEAKKFIKEFNKSRNSNLNSFKKQFMEKGISKAELENYNQHVQEETFNFQNSIIDRRLSVVKKFSTDEWENIISNSTSAAEQRLNKEAKKAKDTYASLDKVIEKTISEKEKADKIMEIMEEFKGASQKFDSKMSSVNTKENSIVNKQNATKTELMEIASDVNKIREDAFYSLIDLRYQIEQITTDTEWNKIIKELLKTLN